MDAKLLTQSVHFQENVDDRKFYIQTTITKADGVRNINKCTWISQGKKTLFQ